MYFALAMVNHRCSPNCAKFAPAGNTGSEIVAITDIVAGEEVTIHYHTTVERPHHARAADFQAQHFAALPPTPFGPDLDGGLDEPQVNG